MHFLELGKRHATKKMIAASFPRYCQYHEFQKVSGVKSITGMQAVLSDQQLKRIFVCLLIFGYVGHIVKYCLTSIGTKTETDNPTFLG